MQNRDLLERFYSAFSNGNSEGMIACYHENVTFEDPAFGTLEGERAKAMWEMLLSKKEESKLNISYKVINDHEVHWKAKYLYGPNKRPVTNKVQAKFQFQDGKIVQHVDHFSLWKWSQQALGASGLVIGWSTFMRNKIQKTTNKMLSKFMEKA